MITQHTYKAYIEKAFPQIQVKGRIGKTAYEKVKHKCVRCKHTFFTSRYNMVEKVKKEQTFGCPKCQKEITNQDISNTLSKKYSEGKLKNKTKYTEAQYNRECKKRGLLVLEPFENMRKSIQHQCLKCSHTFSNSPSNIIYQDCGCSRCRGKHKKTLKEYGSELIDIGLMWIPLEYRGSRKSSKHKCISCDYIYKATPDNMLRKKYSCPRCFNTRKKVVTIKNVDFLVEGFEDIALDYLINHKNIDAKTIETSNVPKIPYKFAGKKRKHIPDIFLENSNTIVEVKSLYTLGLQRGSNLYSAERFYMCASKARASIRKGYKYKLLIFEADGNKIPTPRNWYALSFRQMLSKVKNSSSSSKSSANT